MAAFNDGPFERNYDKDKTLVKDPFLATKLLNDYRVF